MDLKLTVFMLPLLSYMTSVDSESFTSTANLVHLVEGEQKLLDDFVNYVNEKEARVTVLLGKIQDETDAAQVEIESAEMEELKSYIAEMKLSQNIIKERGAIFYAGHPIDAYRLIKRWHRIINLTKDDLNFSSRYKNLPTPSHDDVLGAMAALLRLQRVFAMDTEDMMLGTALTETGVHSLTKDDCIQIGQVALDNFDYGLAIQWTKLGTEDEEEMIDAKILHTLAKGFLGIGDHTKAVPYAKRALEADTGNSVYEMTYKECKAAEKKHGKGFVAPFTEKTWERELPDWRINYEKLCRGEIDATADPEYAKDLVCRYKKTILPYFVFKEEILSWEPRIGMFYDVITEKEAQYVINAAYPKLFRAKVGDPAKAFASSERVSKVAWLWDSDNRIIKRLSKKVSIVTGLDTKFSYQQSRAEPFQVVNYGMGGQYEPHVDFYEDPLELSHIPDYLQGTGDRISTFLYYLSNIRIGGATVFPKVNIRVPPVKNAAAFWYNAKLNGDMDGNTQHAGCPVLAGQKWVVNKWIRQGGQEFRRLCGLTPDAVDRS